MADITYILKPEQIEDVQKLLSRDKSCNYSRLEYYLKQIIGGKDVTFDLGDKGEITVPSQEAWRVVVEWSQGVGSLPVGDRQNKFNMKSRATHLLDYLQTNVSGKTSEAAGNYRLILEQASVKPLTAAPQKESNLQKIFDLRRTQIEIQQAGLIGKIITKFEASKILEGVPDKLTRTRVLQMIAAANTNFRDQPKNSYENFTAEKVQQLLLHQPGFRDSNSIMRLLYAEESQKDFSSISNIINETIKEEYGNNEAKYQSDMSRLRSINSLAPGLDSIPHLIESLNISQDSKENTVLAKALRSQIVSSARGEHQDGIEIIEAALVSAGFPKDSADRFGIMIPFVEEIQIKQRHLLLGDDPLDYDPRLIATSGLAAELGIDLTTPWLNPKDLNQITEKVISKTAEEFYNLNPSALTGGKKIFTLQDAFDFELAKGDGADPQKLAEFSNLMSKHADYKIYHDTVDGNFGYQIQEAFSKGVGNYQAYKKPIDRLTTKIWGGISNIDDTIRWPARTASKWWEKTQEKYPWLNPGALIAKEWVKYQTGVAINIHKWAIGVDTTKWFSGFAKNIGDFTEGFIKHEGNWGGTGIFFVKRKIGNVLDWGTKKFTKDQTFKALRGTIAKAAWAGFTKVAPNLAAKMVASGLSKVIIGAIAGEMTMGVSIAIQIGWEVLKFGFSTVARFFRDSEFRNKILNRMPLIIGGLFSSLGIATVAAVGAIPGAVAAIVAGIATVAAALLSSLLSIFSVAAIATAAIVATLVLVWFGIISPTFNIDSGASQLFTSIVCNDSSNSADPSATENNDAPTSKVASCATCLVKYLDSCYGKGTKITGSVFNSKIGCFIASKLAPEVVSAIKISAEGEGWLQCIGFARAAAVCAYGGTFEGRGTAAAYINNAPPGYRYASGAASCTAGDLGLIDGDIGHIFVWGNLNGPMVDAIDANFRCSGCATAKNPIPLNTVAGCLKRI